MKHNYVFRQAPVWSLVLLFIAGFGLISLQAQDIIHPTSGTSIESVPCGTTLNYYDSGGASGNYSSSESGSVYFCPGTPGESVTISFSSVGILKQGVRLLAVGTF